MISERAARLREDGLDYIARDFAVLPVNVKKQPATDLIRSTRGRISWKILRDKPADAEEFLAWDERAGGLSAIGVICGEASGGLVVVDNDEPLEDGLSLPTTATVKTARGAHRYYRAKGNVKSQDIAGMEIRSDGRYVVAPHSLHSSGACYEWVIPLDQGLENFPEDLLSGLLHHSSTRLRPSRTYTSKQAAHSGEIDLQVEKSP